MIQKVAQYFDRMMAVAAKNACQPISAGIDISYEAGRRIGVMQGMEQAKKALFEWQASEDTKEKDSDL